MIATLYTGLILSSQAAGEDPENGTWYVDLARGELICVISYGSLQFESRWYNS